MYRELLVPTRWVVWLMPFCCLLASLSAAPASTLYSDSALPITPSEAYRIRTIVIDPGHGGKDPGCSGHKSIEKKICLSIALKLGRQIRQAFPHIKVVYTRTKDTFVELHKRAEVANEHRADLFISIHCNSAGKNHKPSGSETYVLGLHRSDDNLEVVRRENAVIRYERDHSVYDNVADRIESTALQSAHLDRSIMLARAMEEEVVRDHRKSRGVKQAGFMVLRTSAVPSVLIEAGFLSNKKDSKRLNTTAGQLEVAKAIFRAIKRYKAQVETGSARALATTTPKGPHMYIGETTGSFAAKGGTTSGSRTAKVYRVQLAASPTRLDIERRRWRQVKGLTVKYIDGRYKYYSQSYRTLAAAKQARKQLVALGFDDAFIKAFSKDESS